MFQGALKSNTVQFNILATILWGLGALLGADFIKNNPDTLAIVAGLQGLVNVLLRFKTSVPLSEK